MKNIILIMLLGMLTSCATILSGTHQNVSVNTGRVRGATCALANDKGVWQIKTPGSVVVDRSYNDLNVLCKKPGIPPIQKKITSKTKSMAFAAAVFNGIIGTTIDVVDGAAYDYPNQITLPMGQQTHTA